MCDPRRLRMLRHILWRMMASSTRAIKRYVSEATKGLQNARRCHISVLIAVGLCVLVALSSRFTQRLTLLTHFFRPVCGRATTSSAGALRVRLGEVAL